MAPNPPSTAVNSSPAASKPMSLNSNPSSKSNELDNKMSNNEITPKKLPPQPPVVPMKATPITGSVDKVNISLQSTITTAPKTDLNGNYQSSSTQKSPSIRTTVSSKPVDLFASIENASIKASSLAKQISASMKSKPLENSFGTEQLPRRPGFLKRTDINTYKSIDISTNASNFERSNEVMPQITSQRPILPMKKAYTSDLIDVKDAFRPPVPPQSHVRVRKQIKVVRPKDQIAPPTDIGANRASVRSAKPIEASLKLPVSRSSTFSDTMLGGSRESSVFSSRSPSPISSRSSLSSYSTSSYRAGSCRSLTPRRVFPQTYNHENSLNMYDLQSMEQSPVVFDANLSFVMGCKKQPVRQTFRPSPAHLDPQTASNYLSAKIDNFLKRTDHVMEEWQSLGRPGRDDDTMSLIERQRERSVERGHTGRSRSATNILIKGYQLAKTLPPTQTRSRSNSVAREMSQDDSSTITEADELSEMTVDLTEERSAANITSERLEAETAERLKLEKELQEQQAKVKNLQVTSEKLEMELICAKSDLNGISEDEDPDNDEGGGVYKLKYERVARELEFTKRRLQTQHEHDLEQLVGLKKQLEKKLADAYEEVEEQRQVVGQWKRKAQKITNEMNDLRMLLEEQNSRNNLLEKKQRKFDAECQSLQDAARQERQAKDRLSREKDVLIAEKFTLEQNLADTRLELELKEEKLSALQRDLEEMTFGGGTEEEVAQLRRSKMDLERRLKEQEEELDDMAGQVQLLEQAKLRLEMTLETVRKEARREAQQRDEELEEARGSSYKKIKALECQLETEHEERTLLLREKHELERRLQAMEEQDRCDRAAEEATNQKLRRDIRKYKALLKDAHSQLERAKADSPGKALIRQLRNQLEDAESARSIAMKARQSAEAELADVQASLEDAQRARSEAEEKSAAAQRDRVELQAQIEENEEEMSELMKKYSATVKQLNSEQNAMSEYEIRISELEAERNSLKEQVAELQTRLENIENMSDPSAAVQSKRFELRAKELESRLELEQATRARLEIQSNRHKDALEKLQNEISQSKIREIQAQDALKKAQKSLRELREEFHMVSNREQECTTRRKDLEKKLEAAEAESASLRSDLRLALQRIADLQQAMEEGDEDVTESDDSESTEGSLSDIEQRLRLIQTKRPSTSTPISTVSTKDTNGLSDTTLVIKEKKGENSPRITITSPGSTTKGTAGETLKNGDTSFA